MTWSDAVGLIASYAYSAGITLGAAWAEQRLSWPPHVARKIAHIGAGLWIWGILLFFDHWPLGLIPFGAPIILHLLSYRVPALRAAGHDPSAPQTIYFSLSITIVLALLWRPQSEADQAPIATAAIMTMTLGDGLAGLVGQRWGRHSYSVGGHVRTWEGSAVMAAVSLTVVWIVLLLTPGSAFSPRAVPLRDAQLALTALGGAAAATLAEAVSPSDLDNLSAPLASALAMMLISGARIALP